MDHCGPDCENNTAEGYLRPHVEVCARRRAISCTSRRYVVPAPPSTTPPASVLKPPAPIPPRVGRDIKNEGNVETTGRTRGETRVMRDALQVYAHCHGVLSTMEHAALVSMLATRESTKNVVGNHLNLFIFTFSF